MPMVVFHCMRMRQDGKKRALLDKYDEEDAEDAMEIGEDGGVDQEKVKRQKEIRAKLAAGVTGTAETAEMEVKSISDFYTSVSRGPHASVSLCVGSVGLATSQRRNRVR